MISYTAIMMYGFGEQVWFTVNYSFILCDERIKPIVHLKLILITQLECNLLCPHANCAQ